MKNLTGLFVIASLLAATTFSVAARDLLPKEKTLIEGVTKQRLKDPDSAKFYWQDYKGSTIYCAHVNAKNSYGGYAGKSLLIAGVKTNAEGEIISAEVTTHNDNMMDSICTEEGYQP